MKCIAAHLKRVDDVMNQSLHVLEMIIANVITISIKKKNDIGVGIVSGDNASLSSYRGTVIT